MKNIMPYLAAAVFTISAISIIDFHIRSINRAVNALESAAGDLNAIRQAIAPAPAMRTSVQIRDEAEVVTL